MFKFFYPKAYAKSTYVIPFEKLYQKGYRGLLFDIDNTLVPHGAPADERSIQLFERLHKIGFRCCLLSNNKEERVKSFNMDAGADHYLFNALKPLPRNYLTAMEKIGTNLSNTIFIGDQLFTDIFGANRAGIRTILVEPMDPREEIQIVLKRYLEKLVLFFYKRDRKKKKRKTLKIRTF